MMVTAKPKTSGFLIRQGTPGDADAISRVLHQAFAGYRPLYTPRAFRATALSRSRVLERMREGPVWVVLMGDVVVATASAMVTERGCYVRGMGVIPAARGHRIGWKLLETIEQSARDKRLPLLYLSTTPFLDRAISLYEHYGFHRTEDGPPDLFETPLFTMVKPLTSGIENGSP